MPTLNARNNQFRGACVPGRRHWACGSHVHMLLSTHPNAVFMLLLTCGLQTGKQSSKPSTSSES